MEGTSFALTPIINQLLTGDAFPVVTKEVAKRAVVAHEETSKRLGKQLLT